MIALFLFSIRQLLFERKLWFTLLLFASPVLLALLINHFDSADNARSLWELFHEPLQRILLGLVVPIVCTLYGTALIGSEVEGRTLVYLITRRLRRGTVLLVRFVAVAAVLIVLGELSTVAHYFCTFANVDLTESSFRSLNGSSWSPKAELTPYLTVVPLAVATYLTIFTAFGVLFTRPLAAAMVFIVVVELIVGNQEIGVRAYSVSHQLRLEVVKDLPHVARLFARGDAGVTLFPPGATGLPNLVLTGGIALGVAFFLVTTRELIPSRIARE